MALDESKLRDALHAIHARLTSADAAAIVDVIRIAASADGTTAEELVAIRTIARILYDMAGTAAIPEPSKTIDASRLLDIGNQLGEDMGKRELAYACAMTVMFVDKKLSPEEDTFGEKLAEALLLDNDRVNQIDLHVLEVLRA